jgi:hypothetical protein
MKKSILNIAVTTATAITIAACSSGSDVAGIGGSGVTPVGFTSSGTITGFGSIFVNGVEFETSSSTFSIDDTPGIESDLAVGMRVTVSGSVNDDGVTGTATNVSFDDDLQGPVGPTITENLDQTVKTITLLGRSVNISSTRTSFDKSGSNPALTGVTFDYDTIVSGQYIEVSGFFNASGEVEATRIELKATTFDFSSNLIEIRGTIENLDTNLKTFNLVNAAGITIDASSAIIDDSLSGGLADGVFVEVKGNCSDASCASLNASKVEPGLESFDDNYKVEVEGIITRYVDDSDFDVNGFPVDASGTGVERIPPTFTLGINKEVEVEGNIVNGKLVASKVKDEGDNIKIAATVTSVDSSSGSFELTPISGQPAITVKVDTSTQFEDDVGNFNSAALLDNLNPGSDYLVVEGYDDGTGTVIASEVERESADDVIIQGIITAGSSGSNSVTILGVTIPFSGNTEFEDANDQPINADAFFGAIQIGSTLVKVKDKESGGSSNTPVGTADEIEIELP